MAANGDGARELAEQNADRIDAIEAMLEDLRGQTNGTRPQDGAVEDELTDGDQIDDAGGGGVSRRTILRGAAALGLGGFAVGSASASEPRGVIGSDAHNVRKLYLHALSGSVTGGSELTTLAGDGLALSDGELRADATNVGDEESLYVSGDDGTLQFRTVRGDGSTDVTAREDELVVEGSDSNSQTDVSDDGSTVVSSTNDIDFGSNLDASADGDGTATVDANVDAATNWEEADSDDLLETSSPYTGIDVADVQTDSLAGGVTGNADLTSLPGNGLTVSAGSLGIVSGGVDSTELANDSVTVAGNSVALGSSTGVDYVDLGDTGSSFPIPNGDIANSSLTVAGNSVSLGGSTGIGHSDLSGIGSSDHHTRPSAGSALAENGGSFDVNAGALLTIDGSNNLAVDEGSISHDSIDQTTVNSGDHHTRPSAGDGLTESSNTFDVEPSDFAGNALEDDGSDDLAVASGSIGPNELANAQLRDPGSTTDLSSQTSIGSWVQPSSSRPSFVQVWLFLKANDSQGAAMQIQVDETGDQNQDYNVKGLNLPKDVVNSGTTPSSQEGRTFYVPAGGHFKIRNINDPEGNQINDVRAVIM